MSRLSKRQQKANAMRHRPALRFPSQQHGPVRIIKPAPAPQAQHNTS